MLRNSQLAGGLRMFFFQFIIQAGVFFTIPLFLSVVLGLSALQTGVRLVPLSIALLAAAIGIPKLGPRRGPAWWCGSACCADRRDAVARRRDRTRARTPASSPSRCC